MEHCALRCNVPPLAEGTSYVSVAAGGAHTLHLGIFSKICMNMWWDARGFGYSFKENLMSLWGQFGIFRRSLKGWKDDFMTLLFPKQLDDTKLQVAPQRWATCSLRRQQGGVGVLWIISQLNSDNMWAGLFLSRVDRRISIASSLPLKKDSTLPIYSLITW